MFFGALIPILTGVPAAAADVGSFFVDQKRAQAVAVEIGQVGTQFDGLAHLGIAVGGAADKAWRFMYVWRPVPIVGATGSIGVPLAIG